MIKFFILLLCPLLSLAVDFSAGLGTEFPIGWSVDGKAAFPEQSIYTRIRAGKFVPFFTDSMNNIAESQGFYNGATGEIVAESLKDATHWELAVGYQQNSKSGWVTDLAYTSISGKGNVTGAVIAEAVNGIILPNGTNIYEVEGDLQNVTLRVGYQWEFQPSMILTLSGGVMKPVNSDTNLDREVTGPIQQAILDAANRELDEYMKDTYENDVIIPLIGVTYMYGF